MNFNTGNNWFHFGIRAKFDAFLISIVPFKSSKAALAKGDHHGS